MGKRRRNERMVLQGTIGVERTRHCTDHNEPVKPYQLWPNKTMRFFCKAGCDLNKNETVLKQKVATVKKNRWK